MTRRYVGVDPVNFPAGTCYSFDVDLEEVAGVEVVLSEVFPEAFPKKRKRVRTHFHVGTVNPVLDDGGPILSIKERAKKAARAAYDSALEIAQNKPYISTAKERFCKGPAANEARLLAIAATGGPNNKPRIGWHHDSSGFVTPDGELIRNSRQLVKYRDGNIQRWKIANYALSEFCFETTSKSPCIDLEPYLEELWAKADQAPWIQAENDEREDTKEIYDNPLEYARSTALNAASSAGTRDPKGIVDSLFLSSSDTKEDDAKENRKASQPIVNVEKVVLPNTISQQEKSVQGSAIISAPVSSRGPMLIKSKIKRTEPVKQIQTKEKIVPPPRKQQRYNVIERLESVFAGGAIADDDSDSNDVDDSGGSYYRDDDSFIDDSEMIALAEERAISKRTLPTDFNGFFATSGQIKTRILPIPKRKKSRGESDSESHKKRRRLSVPGVDVRLMITHCARINFNQINPKRGESAIRYENYKQATTVPQALELGASRADIKNDLLKGHLKLIPDQGKNDQDLKRMYNIPDVEKMCGSPTIKSPMASPSVKDSQQKQFSPPPHIQNVVLDSHSVDQDSPLHSPTLPVAEPISSTGQSSSITNSTTKKPKARKPSTLVKKNHSTSNTAKKPAKQSNGTSSSPKVPAKSVKTTSTKKSTTLKKPAAGKPAAEIKKKPSATRRVRCGECTGCKGEECGICKFCLDKPSRGGENKLRRPCLNRRCLHPKTVGPKTVAPTKSINESIQQPQAILPSTEHEVISATPLIPHSVPPENDDNQINEGLLLQLEPLGNEYDPKLIVEVTAALADY